MARGLRIAGVLGLTLALCGCAAGSALSPRVPGPATPDEPWRRHLIYVADNEGVEIYPAGVNDPPRIGRITDGIAGADGLFVDQKGNLYVANLRGADVTVYRPGRTVPFEKYSTAKNPTDVVVGDDGTVYISQTSGGCICVTEYAPGSFVPKLTIPLEDSGGYPLFMALDSANNLYVSIANLMHGYVLKVPSGKTKGKELPLGDLITPRGLGFTSTGALAVANDTLNFEVGYVDVYRHSKTGYELLEQFAAGPQPEQITFGRNRVRMYVADASYFGHGGSVAIFEDENGWQLVGRISRGLHQPSGVALSPGTP